MEEISFGVWLHKQRRALDLTRQAFAAQVGCAEVTLRRIEAGTLKPSKELAGILLEKLGVPETEWPQWISFARGASDLPGQSPSLSNKPNTNLPVPITSFVGREREQREIAELTVNNRLITLTGIGGVGKTRLSLELGKKLLPDYADGVWLVELAPLSDPTLVVQKVARVFDINQQSNRDLATTLIDVLRVKMLLLIFDDCEHLLDACAQLANNLLKNCPNLKILATSREPLAIAGEALYQVPSLMVPNIQQFGDLDKLIDFDAIRLFNERAQVSLMSFSMTMDNAPIIAQICRQLDGIPLAIELAATWIRTLSCEEIAQEIEQGLDFLTTSRRGTPERHRSMQAVFDHSWNLLSDEEKRVLRKLSVFHGGFQREAAEQIAGLSLPVLTALVEKSFVHRNVQQRYDMHELLRQYAHEKLLESAEVEQTQNRHLEFCLKLAAEAEPKLRGTDQAVWLDRLEEDHANLLAALQWSLQQEDAEAGLRLVGHLWWFWFSRGYWSEGRKWLTTRIGTQAMALRTQALSGAGWLALFQGDYKWVTMFSEEILTQYWAMGDKGSVATLLDNLGMAAEMEGDDERAKILFSDALALRRVVTDKAPIANSLLNLGIILFMQGNYEQAKSLFEEGLAINRELDDQWNTTWSWLTLGYVDLFEGRIEQGLAILMDNLAQFQRFGDKLGIIYCLLGVAIGASSQGKLAHAASLFGAAEILSETMGFQLPPGQRENYEHLVSAARDQLDETIFTTAWSEGRGLSMEQAISYALAGEIQHSPNHHEK